MLLFALLIPVVLLTAWLVGIKVMFQKMSEPRHHIYRVESFPPETEPEKLTNWVHSLTGTLRPSTLGFLGIGSVPAIVFEVIGTKNGITHYVKVPWGHKYVVDQLYSHIPGIRIVEEQSQAQPSWKHAIEVGATHSFRTYDLEPERMWHTIRGVLNGCRGDEQIILQWIVTPALPTELPEQDKAQTLHPNLWQALSGDMKAHRGEVDERRKKGAEPNVVAVLRVASYAKNADRAEHLLDNTRKALASARGKKAHFTRRPLAREADVIRRIEQAQTPFSFPIKLNLTELVSLIGWPIGSSLVAGVATSMSRQFPPSSLYPSRGRVLGSSNLHGSKRNIAMDYDGDIQHIHVLGRTGTGKTTLLTNMVAQDIHNGNGVIVIEAKDDLFNRTLDVIPPNRLEDVIILDINESEAQVGFNIFDQGENRTAIDELSVLISGMYRETAQSITAPQMLYHFTHALAEIPRATFMDLPVLMRPAPQNSPEWAWRDYIGRQVKNPQVSGYLQAYLNSDPREQDRMAAPLYNRIWEFMSRPEIRLILGQRTSSFQMRDVIEQNKILLVSLSGSRVGKQTASLMGTLLVNAIWQAVRTVTPDKPNFLYMDEFADYVNLPVDIESILAKSRSAKLGMVLGHQNLAQVPPGLRDGVMANTSTKIAFRVSARDSDLMAREYGGWIEGRDLVNLPPYEAIVTMATVGGSAPPVSIATKDLPPNTFMAARARHQSRQTYGRQIAAVERDLLDYQVPEQAPKAKRPRISGS